MKTKWIGYFLRFSISIAFLSAVLDRFGVWPKEISAWGNWESFVSYTGILSPWAPESVVPILAGIATAAEVVLAILLLVGYKLDLAAKASGILLLLFGLSMVFTVGIKAPLDYSVFTAAAAAFAISALSSKND
ncbi:DoxX family protein [Spongiimicrobium sp. 3-5]|uniref:DoxX family protein n=1 Tax=Spongiimicrobium sp. 3-5 TaxID=3332596 RepID=UPI0039812D72